MKLIIQIPCYNEAKSLPVTLASLPREVDGFDVVEWLVIDDGSTDETSDIATKLTVDHVVRFNKNRGLASAFYGGIEESLAQGADVIVNTDADNQYDARDIPALTAPILAGKAEMVIGARPVSDIQHFSPSKKFFNRLGSAVVRAVSGTSVPDAPSGFRAYSREAAKQINVFSEYTYTIETIIQAGMKNIAVTSVPIRVNEDLRPSRLVKSIASYIRRSLLTILRIFVVYRPFRFFGLIGALVFLTGVLTGLRFVYYYLIGEGGGHVQSLILAALLSGIGAQTVLVAFLADLVSVNRVLLEKIKYMLRDQCGDKKRT
jgi:glycosyltransferase involved in cell wall biosynthesis